MDRKIAALLLALPFLGCWDPLPDLQTVHVSGTPADLGKLEGRWFSEDGRLIALVRSTPEPRFSVRIPGDFPLKDARFQNGAIVFHAGSDGSLTFAIELLGTDGAVLDGVPGTLPGRLFHSGCCFDSACWLPVSATVLSRNPTPAWLRKETMRKAAKETAEIAHKAYEGVFDRIARVL
ncbi:MAG TPA: hypothetical protein VF789_22395 [Thermoanaerobaculia bacterium]